MNFTEKICVETIQIILWLWHDKDNWMFSLRVHVFYSLIPYLHCSLNMFVRNTTSLCDARQLICHVIRFENRMLYGDNPQNKIYILP